MAKKIICMLTVLSIVFSSLPILTVTAEEAVKTATQITSAEQLVDGQYVIVTETNFAMTVFDSTWVLSKAVTPVDGKLTDVTSDMIWNVTTDGASATLTDSNGASIAPKGGNNNGIKSGEYSWSIIFNDGMFQFAGVDADTVKLSANVSSDSKFRAYKNTTIEKSPNGYIANFYIFAIDEEGGSDTPDVPDVPDTPDVPETNEYGTAVSTGSCGAEAVWTLYDSGTLVISGTGAMNDYSWQGAPWYEHRSSIKNVIIEDGVTTIGSYVFYNCTSLTSVTIPSSVTAIGNCAFYDCTSLTYVTIGNGVTTIGGYAFLGCTSLTSVTIPDGVTTIGDDAFYDCTSLTYVTIGSSVTTIGKYAFRDCYSLTSISVGVNNKNYSSDEDGVLFNKEKTQLIQYPTGNTRTSYTIPDSVTTIGDYAFYQCSNLTSVTIPNSVTTIGDYAFERCESLTSVTIPDSVTTIGDYAFQSCESLTSVTIPDSVTTIGDFAFSYCTNLTSISVGVNNKNYSSDEDGVLFNKEKTQLIQYPKGNTRTSYTIPSSVTTIGKYAFYNCYILTSVTIPDGVTTIGDHAFGSCINLTSVTIPDSVTTIGDYAFSECYSLTSVTIPNSVTAIGNGAFFYCASLTSVTIPNSVTTIGYDAFYYCTSLTSVTIGNGVTEIGTGAFESCKSLKEVVYQGTEEEWNAISIMESNDELLNAEIVYLTVEAEGIEISSLPSKLEYAYGESLCLDGIVVKVYFSDGTVAETTEYTVSEFNKYSYGKQTLTVFYGELFAEFSVTVKAQKAPVSDSTVALGMTVGELKVSYGEQTVYVLSSDGKTVLSDSDVVKTGSVIQIVQDGAVVDSAALVVESDVDGDGRLTAKDFIRLKKQIAQGSWVEYPEYADINRDGVVDTLDLEALALAIA